MYYDTAIYWNEAETSGINKDSLLVMQALTARGRVLMAGLCDGAGEMGEYAGGYLTKELMEWFYDGLPKALVSRNPLSVIRRHVERTIYRTQRRIYEYTEAHGVEYRETENYGVEYHETKDYGVKERVVSLETTVSLLILWEKKYMLWNFGDNKVYRFSADNRVKCPLSDFETGTVKNKDVFLVCSNSFERGISKDKIADILTLNKMSGIPAPNKIAGISVPNKTASISALNKVANILKIKELSMERYRRRLKEIAEAAIRKGERGNMSAVCIRISSHKIRKEHIKNYIR